MIYIFSNGQETKVQSQVESYQRLKKLLNTQLYNVRIKGKDG